MTGIQIQLSAEDIKNYAKKLRHRKLAFIGDEESIEIVKEGRKKEEWNHYRKYIPQEYSILVQMGIALRKLEYDAQKLENLRRKINSRYGKKGLHIAQFVQNGMLLKMLSAALEMGNTESDVRDSIKELLDNIETLCIFVQKESDPEDVAKNIEVRIRDKMPQTMILFSSGAAREKLGKVRDNIEGWVSQQGYGIETIMDCDKITVIYTRE